MPAHRWPMRVFMPDHGPGLKTKAKPTTHNLHLWLSARCIRFVMELGGAVNSWNILRLTPLDVDSNWKNYRYLWYLVMLAQIAAISLLLILNNRNVPLDNVVNSIRSDVKVICEPHSVINAKDSLSGLCGRLLINVGNIQYSLVSRNSLTDKTIYFLTLVMVLSNFLLGILLQRKNAKDYKDPTPD